MGRGRLKRGEGHRKEGGGNSEAKPSEWQAGDLMHLHCCLEEGLRRKVSGQILFLL